MELRLIRNKYRSAAGYTIGELRVDECGYLCDTLEPEDRGLRQDMSLELIKRTKVYGKTAIPTGRYRVKVLVSPRLKDKYYAAKYGGRFPCITDVPGFSGVLIHPGNTNKDTRGCVLPGEWSASAPGRVSNSVNAFSDLMDFYIWPAYQRKEAIWITIE